MNNQLIILIFSLSINIVNAQTNLVCNGNLEQYIGCPEALQSSQIYDLGRIPCFSNPNTYTPDYFNVCDSIQQQWFNVPNNIRGSQYAKNGVGYGGIATWDKTFNTKREYLQIRIKDTLRQGHNYKFTCYLSLADLVSTHANADLGVHFDEDSLKFGNQNVIPLAPQIINNTGNFFSDTTLWQEFSGNYIAEGGERYLIIGNFEEATAIPDTLRIQNVGTMGEGTYYYIDDVSLIDLDSTLAIREHDALAQKLNIFPNPSSKTITLSKCNANDVVNMYDITGKQLCQTMLNDNKQINIEYLEAGIYILKVQSIKGLQVGRFVKE